MDSLLGHHRALVLWNAYWWFFFGRAATQPLSHSEETRETILDWLWDMYFVYIYAYLKNLYKNKIRPNLLLGSCWWYANFIDNADMFVGVLVPYFSSSFQMFPVGDVTRTTSQSYQRRKHVWKPKVVKFERWMKGAGASIWKAGALDFRDQHGPVRWTESSESRPMASHGCFRLKPGRFQLPWPDHVTCLWWYRLRVGLSGECFMQSVTLKARSMSPCHRHSRLVFRGCLNITNSWCSRMINGMRSWPVTAFGILDSMLDTSLRLLDGFSYSGREKIWSYLWLLISGLHTLKFIMVVTVSFSWIFRVTHMVVLRNLGQHKSFTDPRSSLKAKIAATWLRRSFD